MAKSENMKNPTGGQTELVQPGAGTTQASDVDAKLAELRAAEERLAEQRRLLDEDRTRQTAELERQRRTQEEDLARQRRNQEETAQQLRAGAEELERRQSMMATATPPDEGLQAGDTRTHVKVRNNSVRAINIGGTTVFPGKGQVPADAWSRLFDRNGTPVPGAQEHFDTAGGKRPDLQEMSLQNLSMLPDDDAVEVVNESTDAALLEKFISTDPRVGVKKAIRDRIKALES